MTRQGRDKSAWITLFTSQVGIITICLVAEEGSSLAVSKAYPPRKIRQEVAEPDEFEYDYFYDEIEPQIQFSELYDEVRVFARV